MSFGQLKRTESNLIYLHFEKQVERKLFNLLEIWLQCEDRRFPGLAWGRSTLPGPVLVKKSYKRGHVRTPGSRAPTSSRWVVHKEYKLRRLSRKYKNYLCLLLQSFGHFFTISYRWIWIEVLWQMLLSNSFHHWLKVAFHPGLTKSKCHTISSSR